MVKSKKVEMPSGDDSKPKDMCLLKLDQIGKVVLANVKYADKNDGFSPFLMSSFVHLIKDEYPKVCKVPYAQSVTKIRMDALNEIQTKCVGLPTPAEIVKCVEKIEETNPIIWEDKLQAVLIGEQMKQMQMNAAMQEMMSGAGGDDDGEGSGSIPSQKVDNRPNDMFS